jgi:predicted anti-sigma-YlaC factor YlaD
MEPCQGYKEKLMLDAYGELNEKERFTLEKHLKKCEGCRMERKRVGSFLGRMKETIPTPELSPAQSKELSGAIMEKLGEKRKKSWWQKWDLTGGHRLVPALAATCLIVVALGWFSLKVLNDSPSSQPMLGQNGEVSLITEDREVIENLEFLEEMDILDKLVERVDNRKI